MTKVNKKLGDRLQNLKMLREKLSSKESVAGWRIITKVMGRSSK